MSSGGSRLGGQEASGRASWLDGDAAVPRAAELWTAASAVTPPFIEARRWSAWAGGEGGRGGGGAAQKPPPEGGEEEP